MKRSDPSLEQRQGMCLDKGYDYPEARDILTEFGVAVHMSKII